MMKLQDINMKECSKCKEIISLISFAKNGYSKKGKPTTKAFCKKCDSIKVGEFKKENRALYNALNAKRRATELKATPSWADLEYIKSYYKIAQFLTEHTNEEYHVDHIAPLLGKNICGLHCTENLQVVPAVWNLKKGNRNMEVYKYEL